MCTKLALFTRSRTICANEIAGDPRSKYATWYTEKEIEIGSSKYATWYTEKEIEIGSSKTAFEIYVYAF